MSISTPPDVFLLPLESGSIDTGGVPPRKLPLGLFTSRELTSQELTERGFSSSAHSSANRSSPPEQNVLESDNNLQAGSVANSSSLASVLTKRDSAWYVADEANRLLRILLDLSQLDDIHGPWVLYGPPQTGKTVLAESIALRLTRNRQFRQRLAWREGSQDVGLAAANSSAPDSSLKVSGEPSPGRYKPLCLTAAEWSYQLQEALETNSLPEFQNRFLQAGAVFFDDLQQLKTSPFAQAQLTLLLDKLEAAGIPVLVTLAQHPGQLDELRLDLCSRLNGGLVLPVEHPGPAAKRVLAKLFSEELGLQLAGDALDWLVTSAPITSFTMLLGTIRELSLSVRATSCRAISLATVQALFLSPVESTTTTWPDLIIQVVSDHYQLSPEQLLGPCRRQTTVLARGLAMTLARSLCGFSLAGLGNLFGNRDHSTVLHALQAMAKRLDQEPAVQAAIEQITDKLRQLASFHRLALPAALQGEPPGQK